MQCAPPLRAVDHAHLGRSAMYVCPLPGLPALPCMSLRSCVTSDLSSTVVPLAEALVKYNIRKKVLRLARGQTLTQSGRPLQ